mmetsp:Transcript_23597/g.69728  ORF Transcript_23597/g.69728 Transcript_23597/m.69728 type:complete len:217 (+) Transcript_23597:2915-3565(+)
MSHAHNAPEGGAALSTSPPYTSSGARGSGRSSRAEPAAATCCCCCCGGGGGNCCCCCCWYCCWCCCCWCCCCWYCCCWWWWCCCCVARLRIPPLAGRSPESAPREALCGRASEARRRPADATRPSDTADERLGLTTCSNGVDANSSGVATRLLPAEGRRAAGSGGGGCERSEVAVVKSEFHSGCSSVGLEPTRRRAAPLSRSGAAVVEAADRSESS